MKPWLDRLLHGPVTDGAPPAEPDGSDPLEPGEDETDVSTLGEKGVKRFLNRRTGAERVVRFRTDVSPAGEVRRRILD